MPSLVFLLPYSLKPLLMSAALRWISSFADLFPFKASNVLSITCFFRHYIPKAHKNHVFLTSRSSSSRDCNASSTMRSWRHNFNAIRLAHIGLFVISLDRSRFFTPAFCSCSNLTTRNLEICRLASQRSRREWVPVWEAKPFKSGMR